MNLESVYVPELRREVWIRPRTIDATVLEDTFTGQYHIPPIDFEPKTVLDLGSNIGLTIAHYEVLWPQTVIYGVEMDRENVSLAYRNTTDSIILHAAISDLTGYKTYKTIGENSSSYYLSNDADKIVYSMTLDDLLINIGWNKVDFCKIDIEGAEKEVLSGGKEWMHKIKTILVEIHNEYPLKNMKKILERNGYEVKIHDSHWASLWATKLA